MKRNLLLLISMFVMTLTFAQGDPIDLKGKSITLGEEVTEMVPNTWYFVVQARGGDGFMTDEGAGETVKKRATSNVPEGADAVQHAKYIVRFLESGTEGAYNVQFGTGNYMLTNMKTSANFFDDPVLWTVNKIQNDETSVYFYFNQYDANSEADIDPDYPAENLGKRVDNNGNGNTFAYWESGNINHEAGNVSLVPEGNYSFRLATVVFNTVDPHEQALLALWDRWEELADYYDSFDPGTEPGQYDPDAVARFKAAIDAVDAAFNEGDPTTLTLEEIQALLDELNDSFEAVKKAKIGKVLASGYYRFVASMPYHETVKVIDPESGEEEEEEITVTKAMQVDLNNHGKWSTLDEGDCLYLWRVDYDEATKAYKVYNAATDGRFPAIVTSTAITLDKSLDAVESEMAIEYINDNEESQARVYMHRADDDDEFHCVHQGGHNGGAGKSGNLVGWNCNTEEIMASWWTMVPVSDEVAQQLINSFGPRREHELLVQRYDSLVNEAKTNLELTKDMTIDLENPLVTENEQFSSAMTETNEGSIDNLLDGNYSTFWHSTWSGGNVPEGTHFLQVDLGKAVYGLEMMYGRRTGASNDQSSKFSLIGYTTEPDLEEVGKEDGTYLGDFLFPTFEYNVPLYSNGIMFETPFQYIRIYGEETYNKAGTSKDNRGYWHAGEINFYAAAPNPNSQYSKLGKLATDLEDVINEQENIDPDDLTQEMYDALKNAYDAFLTKFVNPAELRAVIAKAEPEINMVVIGSDPGFWPEGSDASVVKSLIQEAKAYDASGDYTPEQSANYIQQINEALTNLLSSANPIRTDKWYQIKFPSKQMFEDNNWNLANADEKINDEGIVTVEAIFDRVAAPGQLVEINERNFARCADELHQGTSVYFLDEAELNDPEESYFRFVAVGDTTYVLQNKATGLYLRSKGAGAGAATLDIHPTFYNASALGFGTNLIAVKNLEGGSMNNLHVQLANSVCVTWSSNTLNTNSTLMIHEVGDVAELPDGKYSRNFAPGSVNVLCYPAAYSVDYNGALYAMKGIEKGADGASDKVVLTPIEQANAGQPVVLIVEGDYDEEQDPTEVDFILNNPNLDFVREAGNENGLYGTYVAKNDVPAGCAVANKNTIEVTKKTQTQIGANTGYFLTETAETVAEAGDLVFEIGGAFNGIEDVKEGLTKLAKNGKVYNLNGQVVMENGNINSVRNLGAGIYILNGVKILVK